MGPRQVPRTLRAEASPSKALTRSTMGRNLAGRAVGDNEWEIEDEHQSFTRPAERQGTRTQPMASGTQLLYQSPVGAAMAPT